MPVAGQGHDGLHGEPLVAQVEDHSTGDAIKTGEDGAIHFVANATASFGKHG
jgi:hypothetical protein